MEDSVQFAKDLVHRMVPWLDDHTGFYFIERVDKAADKFEIQTVGGITQIGGTSKTAITAGLNYFLKYYCHRSSSHCGDNLSPDLPVPAVEERISVATPFQYRYALNYCTYDYTMPFWGWKEWEKELDWMALNGVNLMLVATGTKAVWQKAMQRFGYSEKEIHEFLPGPVYNAWWLMGNLEGWGGIAAQELIDQQVDLTRKILERMKGLGITPIFHGFYGMVPRSMKKKFPEATAVEQGKWNNVFDQPDMLICSSPLFRRVAKEYYRVVKELYGEFEFFGGDPFHEGGNTHGLDVKLEAAAIQKAMQAAYPGSTWVLQCWYDNPKRELLEGIPGKEKVLILDLFGEVTREWKDREAFGGIPFIWCSINNFGERNGLYGRLEKIARRPLEVLDSKYNKFMKGIGAIPEGIANNPVVYDLIFDSAWRPESFDVYEWIPQYTKYRYGSFNDSVVQAWYHLLETVYSSSDNYQEGPSESVFCARPSLHVTSASTWGTRHLYYDTALLEQAAELMARAAKDLGDSETYRYDLVDIARQVVANHGQHQYDQMVKAGHRRDIYSFDIHATAFLELMLLQDELLSTHPSFMLGTWLKQAKEFRKDPKEKEISEWNARVIITYWGPDDEHTSLHDYANKEWSGLIGDYYYPRWQMFLEQFKRELIGLEAEEVDYFSFEKGWAKETNDYPSEPSEDCVKKVKAVLEKLEKYQYATVAGY